jgi:hypothetical protein
VVTWQNFRRIRPEDWLAEINKEVLGGMTEEQLARLQTCRDVVNGWANAAAVDTGPYRLTLARNRRQAATELAGTVQALEQLMAELAP